MPSVPDPEPPKFRNGTPVRVTGWLTIRSGRLARKHHRFAKLHGEVLSFHVSEHNLAEEEFDINGALIDFSDKVGKRSFRITIGRRVLFCACSSKEEMQTWASSLSFASQRCFEKYYKLGPLIAEGTTSRVYYAYDIDSPRQNAYAVKVIKKRPHDVQSVEWVRRERHVNCLLNHPAIVQAVDMFSTVERDHLVFELMSGGTLAELLLKHKRLPESYARVVFRELMSAIYYIHSMNIVHRDVRPENIFCSAAKFPMSIALGDFGLSTFVSEKRVNQDVLTTMVGVPPYIAPDICRRLKYGPACDVWSAGVILYEMLSGEVPFKARSDREMIEKIKKGVIKFDAPVWRNVSADVKHLILQLTQRDPFKRISALGCLNHSWLTQGQSMSRLGSLNSCPTSPTANGVALGDRDSPGNSSLDARRGVNIANQFSNINRVSSSTSSQSPLESNVDRSESSERQTSLLGLQPSMRSMPHVSSTSSLTGQQRMPLTPSVRAIAEFGLQRVVSDNPGRFKRIMSSSVIQRQLSAALPYRRKLVVTARSFVAVYRLRALARGQCVTRQMSIMGSAEADVDDVNNILDQRKADMEQVNEEMRNRIGDRANDKPLHGPGGPKRGHVRQKSREVASHIIGRLSADRKQRDGGVGS